VSSSLDARLPLAPPTTRPVVDAAMARADTQEVFRRIAELEGWSP
jgi:hypothetical protein